MQSNAVLHRALFTAAFWKQNKPEAESAVCLGQLSNGDNKEPPFKLPPNCAKSLFDWLSLLNGEQSHLTSWGSLFIVPWLMQPAFRFSRANVGKYFSRWFYGFLLNYLLYYEILFSNMNPALKFIPSTAYGSIFVGNENTPTPVLTTIVHLHPQYFSNLINHTD